MIVGDETFTPDANLDWSGTSQRRGSIMNNFGLCLLHDVRRRQSVLLDADDNPRVVSPKHNFFFLRNSQTDLCCAVFFLSPVSRVKIMSAFGYSLGIQVLLAATTDAFRLFEFLPPPAQSLFLR